MYTVYGKVDCPACEDAKKILEYNNVKFEYKTLGVEYTIEDFYEVAPRSHRSFPMITKDGEYLGGVSQLIDSLSNT